MNGVVAPELQMMMLNVPSVQLRPLRRAHCVTIVEAPMLVKRIIIPSAAAEPLLIHDIFVEGVSQLMCPGDGMPARVFSELAVGISLGLSVGTSGSILEVLFENITETVAPLTFAIFGAMPKHAVFQSAQAPTDGRQYHAWVKRRQTIYESLHRDETEDCFFNGQEIGPDTFMPKTALWWVDSDGWKDRPVYAFEKVALGDALGGLQVVNIDTYEGFDGA